MKRKFLLATLLVMLFVCVFALSVSAAHDLKEQTTNAYGDLSFFDETITIGRTDTTNGYTPYKADGTSYARVVIGNGTTFYTFPTYYILTKNGGEDNGKVPLFQYNLSALNSAMEAATGTNPGWDKTSIYRIELPESVTRINTDGTQKFYGFSNVIEIYLPPNSTTIDTPNCLFHSCYALTTIHNIDTFVFKNNTLGGTFQDCRSLTSLTLGVSPSVTTLNDSTFWGCTNLQTVNVIEAFPNVTSISGKNTFNGCKALTSISSTRNDGVVVIPYTKLGQNAFYDCDSIKAIKFTASSITLGQHTFHSLNTLEYIYFPRTATLSMPSCEVFSNNVMLKAVAFPDNCTVIPDRGFKNCSELVAVYLPANLDNLMTNGNDQGAFSSCKKLYFVQDWFSVIDENGEFLFDDFVMPSRPDVYFFPSTMTKLYKRDSGTGFYKNYALNPVMVLPTTITELWVYDGCFYDCGETGNTFTIVCLGDMVNVRVGLRDNRAKGVSYVFANANDVDLTSLNFVDTNVNTNKPNLNGNEYVYFCKSQKCFKIFNADAQFTDANVTWETATFKHFANPDLTKTTGETCLTNRFDALTCFCSAPMGTVEVEDTALGHNHDLENGALLLDIVYSDLTKAGYKHIKCERCAVTDDSVATLPIIYFLGYSTDSKTCTSLTVGFRIDKDAIAAYEEGTGNKITLGVFGVITEKLTHENGVYSPLEAQENGIPVIVANAPDNVYAFNLVIQGFTSEAYRALPISMGAYATINGETVYIQDTQVDSVGSYTVNECIADITPPETTIPGDDE